MKPIGLTFNLLYRTTTTDLLCRWANDSGNLEHLYFVLLFKKWKIKRRNLFKNKSFFLPLFRIKQQLRKVPTKSQKKMECREGNQRNVSKEFPLLREIFSWTPCHCHLFRWNGTFLFPWWAVLVNLPLTPLYIWHLNILKYEHVVCFGI